MWESGELKWSICVRIFDVKAHKKTYKWKKKKLAWSTVCFYLKRSFVLAGDQHQTTVYVSMVSVGLYVHHSHLKQWRETADFRPNLGIVKPHCFLALEKCSASHWAAEDVNIWQDGEDALVWDVFVELIHLVCSSFAVYSFWFHFSHVFRSYLMSDVCICVCPPGPPFFFFLNQQWMGKEFSQLTINSCFYFRTLNKHPPLPFYNCEQDLLYGTHTCPFCLTLR